MITRPLTRNHLIGIAFPAMISCRILGAAISPLLFAHAPLLLIAMSPFLAHLVLVSPVVELSIYFPVALFVTTAQALIGYHFGSVYGARALTWITDRLPLPCALVEKMLRVVQNLSILAIFIVPGPVLGTIAGVAGIRRQIYYPLVAPAQALWVSAAYFTGEALTYYIEIIRTFVSDHALSLTGGTVMLVTIRLVLSLYRKRLKGR